MTHEELEIQFLKDRFDKAEKFIEALSSDCWRVKDSIMPKLLSNIRKTLNERIPQNCLAYSDDMPSNFTAYDTIAALWSHGMYLDEMIFSKDLSDYIDTIIHDEIQKLSRIEQIILYNIEITSDFDYDIEELHKNIYNAFCEQIDKHSQKKKIQNFLDKWY